MKINHTQNLDISTLLVLLLLAFATNMVHAQTPQRIKSIFPPSTIIHSNVAYANDTLQKHLLDIYLPAQAKSNIPLVIWVHGGAWMTNDKYADMGYMKNTLKGLIENGYALASIDYRFSTTAVFPAQMHDCNQAIAYLYKNAAKYNLDSERFALIGFSAGGHLASLIGLSNNNDVKGFYVNEKKPPFKVKAVIDFYGPSDLIGLTGNVDIMKADNPLTLLLGAPPVKRPELAKFASPVTYIDRNDPPFLIIHGEKDQSVPYTQSVLLDSYLHLAGVKSELVIVPGAPHYGEMFDREDIRNKFFYF